MRVFDASALPAFIQGEGGADVVERALGDDGVVGAANWSEVAPTVLARRRDWRLVSLLLRSYGLAIEPVTIDDAD